MMISHTDVGVTQEGGSDCRDVSNFYHFPISITNRGSDCRDVSPGPLGSKESHDSPTVEFSRWLRAMSLLSTMNEHKLIEMRV
jgi:hypothetical protein